MRALRVLFVVCLVVGGSLMAPGTVASTDEPASATSPTLEKTDVQSNEPEPINVTEHYRLTPDDPGNITVTLEYDFGTTDRSSFTKRIFQSYELVSRSGFDHEADPNRLVWDGATEQASATLRLSVDRSSDRGLERVATTEWAFYRPIVQPDDVSVTRTADHDLTAEGFFAFLGPHDVETREVENRTVALVVSDAGTETETDAGTETESGSGYERI